MAQIDSISGLKQSLLRLLIIKYIMGLRPIGNFGAKTIIRQIENGDWEAMNPHFLRNASIGNISGHPLKIMERYRHWINGGVFDNGNDNRAFQMDVFEFLNQIDRGDIIYLDPPYAGTTSYESALKQLDSILEGKIIRREPSVFSKNDALDWLERLFVAANKIPTWIISYGNAELGLDRLTALVANFKHVVKAEEFRYTHLTGLSGEEHRERNREFLIFAR